MSEWKIWLVFCLADSQFPVVDLTDLRCQLELINVLESLKTNTGACGSHVIYIGICTGARAERVLGKAID
jgi:hypothetical protein